MSCSHWCNSTKHWEAGGNNEAPDNETSGYEQQPTETGPHRRRHLPIDRGTSRPELYWAIFEELGAELG